MTPGPFFDWVKVLAVPTVDLHRLDSVAHRQNTGQRPKRGYRVARAAVKTAAGLAVDSYGVKCERTGDKTKHMCQGLNSHYFHILGDGHQPNSRGLYTHYKDSY